jgi:hypothetical protein
MWTQYSLEKEDWGRKYTEEPGASAMPKNKEVLFTHQN